MNRLAESAVAGSAVISFEGIRAGAMFGAGRLLT